MKPKRPKCPDCRRDCVRIIQYREAVFARVYPFGKQELISNGGEVLRYGMQCVGCWHCWRPRDQKNARELFHEVPK